MSNTALTSRGGAKDQDKNWSPFLLPQQTRFIHAGSAPLSKDGGTGLLLKYSKEDVTVAGHADAPKKFILAFPLVKNPPGTPLPPTMVLAKPAQMLWSMEEMPNVFIFTLDAGTKVWSENGKITENKEVGLAFDVIWAEALLAEYTRTSKAQATVVP